MQKAAEERKAANALTHGRKNQFLPACGKSGGKWVLFARFWKSDAETESERNLWSEVVPSVPQRADWEEGALLLHLFLLDSA